jgi:orotate phosphoribosyltransferase
MRSIDVAALATEGPQTYESRRERLAWWTGCLYGAVLGLAVGGISAAYALALVVERAARLAP